MKRRDKNNNRSPLPSPFSIAVILSLLCYLAALFMTEQSGTRPHWIELIGFWHQGLWNLLGFSMQMMLMLILGHSLALSPWVGKMLDKLMEPMVQTQSRAIVAVNILTLLAAFFNWGMGLILGAVLVRKTAEFAKKKNLSLNYGLLGAAGYTGMMVWHGGLSGSAPLTVTGAGHSLEDKIGLIGLEETLFSPMNIAGFVLCMLLIPLLSWWLSKRYPGRSVPSVEVQTEKRSEAKVVSGVEKLDHSPWFRYLLAAMIAGAVFFSWKESSSFSSYLNLNTINLILLGLAVSFHPSVHSFTASIEKAIGGAAGILIQFPLYAGIMGIMQYSGLISVFADFFIRISNEHTFPQLAFVSAGLVNIMVPSGGGQWQVQGPILVEAAQHIGVGMGKTIMALSYGDQLTNMLQPFWALPLLGITGLKPSEIFKYCLMYFALGLLIFSLLLFIF